VPRPSAATRLKHWLCRLVVSAFGWTYLFILALQVLATYDPFNLVPKPLVGVSLIVLGLPWTLGSSSFPEGLQYLAAAIAPAINWLILGFLCAWQRLKSQGPKVNPATNGDDCGSGGHDLASALATRPNLPPSAPVVADRSTATTWPSII
jgi:hypothetical protein